MKKNIWNPPNEKYLTPTRPKLCTYVMTYISQYNMRLSEDNSDESSEWEPHQYAYVLDLLKSFVI